MVMLFYYYFYHCLQHVQGLQYLHCIAKRQLLWFVLRVKVKKCLSTCMCLPIAYYNSPIDYRINNDNRNSMY